MEAQYIWWVAALVLGIAEMLTATFFMLVLALGCAAAGAVAAFAAPLWLQCLVAAGVSVLGLAWMRRTRTGRPAAGPVARNRDVHTDVGEHVQVDHWDAEGRARVNYRGTQWDAQWDPSSAGTPINGTCVVRGLDGNRLILGPSSGGPRSS